MPILLLKQEHSPPPPFPPALEPLLATLTPAAPTIGFSAPLPTAKRPACLPQVPPAPYRLLSIAAPFQATQALVETLIPSLLSFIVHSHSTAAQLTAIVVMAANLATIVAKAARLTAIVAMAANPTAIVAKTAQPTLIIAKAAKPTPIVAKAAKPTLIIGSG